MPSPLAHVGLAWACLAAVRAPGRPGWVRDAAIVAFAAVAADLDILVDLAHGGGIRFHHGPTHSWVFAAGLAWVLSRLRGASGVAVWFAALIHAPLDWTTGDAGAPVKYGVTFFWPLSDQRYIAARPFFPPYHIDASGGLANMFVGEALPIYAREAAVVLAALVAAGLIRGLRTRTRGP